MEVNEDATILNMLLSCDLKALEVLCWILMCDSSILMRLLLLK